MSRIKLLLDVVDDLRCLADSLQAFADVLSGSDAKETEAVPENPVPKAQEPAPVKDPPKVTLEQVRAVLADKSQDGKTAQVRELIGKFGAGKLSEIAPELYADLLAASEEL